MNTHAHDTRHIPPLRIDIDAIFGRLHRLAGLDLCERCALPVTDAIADIARLLSEVTRLHNALIRTRLEKANLEAAIRAALGAHDDSEPDPLAYLRDALPDDPGAGGGWP